MCSTVCCTVLASSAIALAAQLMLLWQCARAQLHSRSHSCAHAGAARDFPQPFVDDYLRMVRACAEQDRDEIILRSTRMGFLTGELFLSLTFLMLPLMVVLGLQEVRREGTPAF